MLFISHVIELLEKNEFSRVDYLFLVQNPTDILQTVALLRITFPVRHILKNRKLFILYLQYVLTKEKIPYDKLLTGLLDD